MANIEWLSITVDWIIKHWFLSIVITLALYFIVGTIVTIILSVTGKMESRFDSQEDYEEHLRHLAEKDYFGQYWK